MMEIVRAEAGRMLLIRSTQREARWIGNERNLMPLDESNLTNLIYAIRGKQVMIDRDLAYFYNVETKVLNQAIK